jgi:hypothetical protein
MLNVKFEVRLESFGTTLALLEAASARYLRNSVSDCDNRSQVKEIEIDRGKGGDIRRSCAI